MNMPPFRRCAFLCLLAAVTAHQATAAAGGSPAPERIVSFGPNITETILDLGAGERLVGVSEFCRWPEEATPAPRRVGSPLSPRLEVLAALRPDLIVIQFEAPAVDAFASGRGIAQARLRMDSMASIERDIARLGRLLGLDDAASSLTAAIRADLAAIARRVDPIPEDRRPLVFLSIERRPGSLGGILSASDRSFLGEALRLAGGRNAFADMGRPYAEVSRETLAARRPEVILEMRGQADPAPARRAALIADWEAMAWLPAVRRGRVAVVAGEGLLVPGPSFPRIVRAIHEALAEDPEDADPGAASRASGH